MKKIALVLACFATLILKAQQNNFNQSPVSMQSPDATQFIRYGDIPMDYSTGVPGISIPLHTVTSGKLSLPIDMSYNASGIKVADVASTIGLGWSLNAGGLVSRTILGMNDQLNGGKTFLSGADIQNEIAYCYNNPTFSNILTFEQKVTNIYRNSTQQAESQSDRFFYSFNGRSGMFRPDFQTGVAKTVPYSALKISTGVNNAGPYKITAEDGTNYYFEQPEWSVITPGYSYNSTYYLTKIESPDLTNTINIYYKGDAEITQFIKSYQLIHKVIGHHNNNYPGQDITAVQDNEFVNSTSPVMPDSITTENETIQFIYITDRPDPRKSRLNKIKVLNRVTREVIKVIEFQHSYFGTQAANNRRLRLDNIYVKDNANTTVQQYGFGYNSTPLPPYYSQLGMLEHHNVDYWGYYNAADDANLIPEEMFDPLSLLAGQQNFTAYEKATYGGNRNPNSATMQACILNEITYPTGGKTNFEYEPNEVTNGYAYYTGHTVPDIYGGLRVKKITSTANAIAPPLVKSYEYSAGRCTMMESALYQYYSPAYYYVDFMNNGQPQGFIKRSSNSTIISTDPLIQMSTGSGSLVLYENVKEYIGTLADNSGYTEYIYDYSSLSPYIFDVGTGGNPLQNGFYLADYGNYKPQLKTKIIYGKGPSNNYSEIKKEEYTYNKYNIGSFVTGVKIQREYPFEKTGVAATLTDTDLYSPFDLLLLLSYYSGESTTGVLDVPLLTQKRETIHPVTGTGDLVTTTNYIYDLVTLQPTKEESINSKGETIIAVNKYPSDFPSTAPYNTMVSKNILTPVIEQLAYKNNVSTPNFLKGNKTNFDYWSGSSWSSSATNIIVPRTVDTRSKDQPSYETRMRYLSYDTKANLTSFQKENDVQKTYLWGYNKTYPVAEIIGADHATASSYFTQSVLDNPVDDASLRSHLNNLRTIPNTFVKTYTYKPLVGITSETDANGKTIYYEYDAFNRLILIRDKDNFIIKKICYNYAGQVENCSVSSPCPTNSTPIWQNTTDFRCEQGPCGNTGYREQRQIDVNSCTNSPDRWVQRDYNPTGCPLPIEECISLTSTNVPQLSGYTATYSNGPYSKSFAVPTTGGLQPLGSIPAGTYTLAISRTTGTPVYLAFYSGCGFKSITGNSATFYNVPVSSTSCNSIKIDYAY